jgi:C4-dicarboxylate-specific signal transduction histidine kinase
MIGLATAEVVRRVATLPGGTVVYTPGYFTDGAGEVTSPRQVSERIAAASSAPVYGAFDTTIGSGIVGGYVSPYEAQARQAAELVAKLLAGTPPSKLSSTVARRIPAIDWRQVRRWGIDERNLPPETSVRFREPTAWQRYRVQFIAGIAIVALQAALIAALLFEVRARRRTSSALAESQKQMNLAASAARLSFWSWDTTSGNVDVSRMWPRTKHRPPAAIAFKEIVESTYPPDREPLQRAASRALATGEEVDIEYRVVDAAGAMRWMAARGRLDRGDAHRLRGVALDVTERKASELRAAQDRSALRHMSRISMVGQLSAAIAHQLNQPLAAILGNAETARKMLDRDRLDTTELQAICDDILSEDRRAADIIRRLSELYGRGDMQMSAVDVNKLIAETLDLLRTELLVRQVTSIVELEPGLPPVEGSRVQLQQVVLNLALNAAEALTTVTDRERVLTIRTGSSGPCILLHVIDNGPGIAADPLDRVFEPFWSTRDAGMGMGLAICQSIVTAHRGSITVANSDRGGAAFCVRLPVPQP